MLAPTPELWTRVLNHRTQILYLADISMICTFLELKPGCIVLESGTGSGSLTHALTRSVAPTGHVYTFEFHQDRFAAASIEFNKHGFLSVSTANNFPLGISENATVAQRDVQSLGFPENFHDRVHGVFLDLPEPWKVRVLRQNDNNCFQAVSSSVKCLMASYCFVSFSPCIEQVQRTCQALRETEDMMDIRIMECLSREYRVKDESLASNLKEYHQQRSCISF